MRTGTPWTNIFPFLWLFVLTPFCATRVYALKGILWIIYLGNGSKAIKSDGGININCQLWETEIGSTVTPYRSAQRSCLSFSRLHDMWTKILKVLTETNACIPLFENIFYTFRTLFSPLNVQLLSIEVRQQVVEWQCRSFSKQRASLGRGAHATPGSRRASWISWDESTSGVAEPLRRTKQVGLAIRIWVRQKSLKPEWLNSDRWGIIPPVYVPKVRNPLCEKQSVANES